MFEGVVVNVGVGDRVGVCVNVGVAVGVSDGQVIVSQ